MKTILYTYKTRKTERGGNQVEIPTNKDLKEILKEPVPLIPLPVAVTEAGFPPEEWAKVTGLEEKELYCRKRDWISLKQFNRWINKIMLNRKEKSMQLEIT